MAHPAMAIPLVAERISDEEVVARVLAGETALFEVIMRRYNQRLYRAARAITHDDYQAEDILQATYVNAYEHLRQYSGGAPFGAWLTRIAVNEALGRLRRLHRVDGSHGDEDGMDRFAAPGPTPEQSAADAEMTRFLESLVSALPHSSRVVFMLREVEGMSTAETAEALGISEENVKVRLHRARGLLRQRLSAYAPREIGNAFPFHATRCDRVVSRVSSLLGYSAVAPLTADT